MSANKHSVETSRVSARSLQKGMFVYELDRPWEETPFLFQGFFLETDEDIELIQQYCDHVYIDVIQSRHAGARKQKIHPEGEISTTRANAVAKGHIAVERVLKSFHPAPKPSRSLSKELGTAIKAYDDANKLVRSMMDEIRLGRSINTPTAKAAVADCVDSIIRNPDAMLLLSRLKTRKDYTPEHSLNVSIISIAFGRHLGMERSQLRELGLCGMLHDMGKMMAPDEILNKPGRLEGKEIEIMKRHPADGREILSSSAGISNAPIDVAYSHHERLDGSGYPRGAESDKLSLYTKMVSIVDVFDAVTSDRAYRDGVLPEDALRMLHSQSGGRYDPALMVKFIECIGIYPVGTLVELHNGEVGLVVQIHPRLRLKPKIRLLLDENKVPQPPRLIDLAEGVVDGRGEEYRIKTAHNPKKYHIDLKKLILGQPSHG